MSQPSSVEQPQPSSSEGHDLDPVDAFLEHITQQIAEPIMPTPMIVPEPEQTESVGETEFIKRRSSRPADKAKSRVGKNTMKVAQELLSEKLGELQTEDVIASETNFHSFSQHFDMPINKDEIEAIQVLVEHGTKLEKQAAGNRGAAKMMEAA